MNENKVSLVEIYSMSLLGGERVAVDGSYFDGNVSAKSFRSVKGVAASLGNMFDATVSLLLFNCL